MSTPTPSLAAVLQRWADVDPDREAAVEADRRLTYQGLRDEVRRWAAALDAQGIGLGDRVAMLGAPSIDSLVSFLATVSVGATWCGLDPRLQPPELLQRLRDLEPTLVQTVDALGERSYAEEIADFQGQLPSIEKIVVIGRADHTGPPSAERCCSLAAFLASATAARTPRETVAADDARLIVYTSGSSGVPRGAMLSESSIVAFCRLQNALWPVSPLRTLNFLPISHVGSVVDLTLPAIVGGGCIVFQNKFDAVKSLRIIPRERITFWASVPSTFLLQVALDEFATTDLSSVQLIVLEGARIPQTLAEALSKIAPMATNYGMTETTSGITVLPATRDVKALTESVGRPYDDMTVRMAPGTVSGEDGEIEVLSQRNFLGYWRAPEATDQAFTDDGFFRTGDLGSMDSDGTLRIAGRKKDMFKSGGYNIYPAEIEAVLATHHQVVAAAVVPIHDPIWGEVGIAFVVAKSTWESEELTRSLVDHCRVSMANYKRPKQIRIVAALPLLSIGKIDRQRLRAMAAELE